VNRDVDLIAEAGQRLVDRVVDDFVDEVVQSRRPVEPMYIAGRLRTASRPSRTLILSAPYCSTSSAVPWPLRRVGLHLRRQRLVAWLFSSSV
jgi:hypothetical protein